MWRAQLEAILPQDVPWPAMPLGCPLTSVGVCRAINIRESCINWLQTTGLSELYCSRNIHKKLLRHTSGCVVLLMLSKHVQYPRPCMFSMLFQWPDFITLGCCGLIQRCHIQPNQLSHQLSIFIQTTNNSYFHLQHSPAKSNFPLIF